MNQVSKHGAQFSVDTRSVAAHDARMGEKKEIKHEAN